MKKTQSPSHLPADGYGFLAAARDADGGKRPISDAIFDSPEEAEAGARKHLMPGPPLPIGVKIGAGFIISALLIFAAVPWANKVLSEEALARMWRYYHPDYDGFWLALVFALIVGGCVTIYYSMRKAGLLRD